MHDRDRTALEQEALRWLSRLTSGTATDADRDALLQWRAQSSSHEQAFQSALKLWKQIGQAAGAKAAAQKAPSFLQSSRRQFLKAGAMAAGVGGIAFTGAQLGFWPGLNALMADYSTAVGERRQVDLAEGVRIDLNTRSALSVNPATAPSNVTLSGGEAVFTVTSNAARFAVSAADGVVAAEQAVFAIRHDDRRVRITCLEGTIEILEPSPLWMRPLEQVVCSGKSLGNLARVAASDVVAGWRNGLLVFRDEPVETVVSELGRYRKGMIVIASSTVAKRRVTGTFHLDRLDEALDHLQQTLQVPMRHFSSYFTLLG